MTEMPRFFLSASRGPKLGNDSRCTLSWLHTLGRRGSQRFLKYRQHLTYLSAEGDNDFKGFKQPEGLTAKSELQGLYEFLVKDAEGEGGKGLITLL